MGKFTVTNQERRNYITSLSSRPNRFLTKRARLLRKKRLQALERRERSNLALSTTRKTPRTSRSIKMNTSSRRTTRTTRTTKPIKFGVKVKKTKKNLLKILGSTKSHIKQAKRMIQFLKKFIMNYNSVNDKEKYEQFASELSAGLYDVVRNDFGDYDAADPVNYLKSFKTYLEENTYAIDPDTINRLYKEFMTEQGKLSKAKQAVEHKNMDMEEDVLLRMFGSLGM